MKKEIEINTKKDIITLAELVAFLQQLLVTNPELSDHAILSKNDCNEDGITYYYASRIEIEPDGAWCFDKVDNSNCILII